MKFFTNSGRVTIAALLRASFKMSLVVIAAYALVSLFSGSASALDSPSLIISEFRWRGPQGANDEFVEIYNNSDVNHFVQTADGSNGYALVAADGVVRFVIPNGTLIGARRHYLAVNSVGYSLSQYPASSLLTATGNATYTLNIPDNSGLALFKTSNPANFNLANRLDAVGASTMSNTLYKEGSGVPSLTAFSIDYSFTRRLETGFPKETNNNAADFLFVDTNGTSAGAGQKLGAPGPENLASPVTGDAVGRQLLDPCAGVGSGPNIVRDYTSNPAENSTFGTIEFRRTFTNTTTGSISRLRFRVIDLSTFPSPSGVADLRPRTTTPVVVTVDRAPCGTGTSNITVRGTTLEQPPSQPNGGGINSSLSASGISNINPLAPGASIDLRFMMGIQQGGNYRLALVIEGSPKGGGAWLMQGNTDNGGHTEVAISNAAPVANADSYSVAENNTLNTSAPGVLSNDTDIDNNPLTASVVNGPTNGLLVLNGNGSFAYTPNTGFSGMDSFTYRVSDGNALSQPATVTITVNDGGTLKFSSAAYSVDEASGSASITVTRTNGTAGQVSVKFMAMNGTATAGADYTAMNVMLNFADGEASKVVNVNITDDPADEADETVNLSLSDATGGAVLSSPVAAVLTILDNDAPQPTPTPTPDPTPTPAPTPEPTPSATPTPTPTPVATPTPSPNFSTIEFAQAIYGVSEGDHFITLNVKREGDTSGVATVDYATQDGMAEQRTDYTIARGTLSFGPGETMKTFVILITDDSYTEGMETASVVLGNAVGALLGASHTATLEISDGGAEDTGNVNDIAEQFVRQHYHDFLNREPDAPGLAFWAANITKCLDAAARPAGQTEAECIDRQRETTSAAFFLSPEFQYTGYYVYRMYKGGMGVTPQYLDYMKDMRRVAAGIIVNNQLSAVVIEANKAAYAEAFVARAEFKQKYDGLSDEQYVDALFLSTGITPTFEERAALINGLSNQTETRATVLQKVVDGVRVIAEGQQDFTTPYGKAFYDAELNNAFVMMEYFGYMRRDPDAPGYEHWLGKLNFFQNYINAEMVRSFIVSPEYCQRFGEQY